jgi:hypothetical protein
LALPLSTVLQTPRGVVQHWWLSIALAELVGEDALGRGLSRCAKVLEHALWRQPGREGYEGVVLACREVGEAGRIRGDMLLLFTLASIALEAGYVEQAVRVGAVDALGGQGLDVAVDAVLKRDAPVERVELCVLVVDGSGVGEVDGEDADALGSCATGLSVTCRAQRHTTGRRVTYSWWVEHACWAITQRPLECGCSTRACWDARSGAGRARQEERKGGGISRVSQSVG